jgi:threonine dehydratase
MQTIEYRQSFVDGAGAKALLPKMWALVQPLIDGAFRVSLDEVAAAIRLLAERSRVIAEGAGALAPAAALSGRAGKGKIVCIVSGGNIDFATLTAILEGRTP